MLLDEDPAILIHECTTNFSLAPDLSSLSRIRSSLSTLSTTRQSRLHSHTASLNRLHRNAHSLSQQHALLMSSHDAAAHAEQVLALDRKKFRIAKEASDAEVLGEREEARCRSVQEELEREGSEREVMAGDGDGEGTEVLRLKLYRSLGVEVEDNRAVVRNTAKGLVRVVDFGRERQGLDREARERIWDGL